ncbi:APC family permease [Acidilobus sp.]|uniref:APC family permease n=1 Tax=Acidilobus sp. TaxID=1872109 RepID=UPI003CFBF3BB
MADRGIIEEDRKLSRSLGLWHYVAINIGAIIGSGWLLAPLGASAFNGPLSVASWAVAAALVAFMAIAYAYLASAAPRTGAVVRYPQMAHGDLVGFSTGALYLLSISSLLPAEAVATVYYASYYVPGLVKSATVLGQQLTVLTPKGLLLALAIVIVIFVINYFGVSLVGNVSLALMIWKIAVPLTVIAALLALAFNPHNFTLAVSTQASVEGLSRAAAIFAAIPVTGIAYALLGFRQAVEYSGEGRKASSDVPKAVILSVAITAVIFILLQVAFIGGLRWSSVEVNETVRLSNGTIVRRLEPVAPGNWSALAVSNIAAAPLASELAIVGLGVLSIVMIIDAWVSPLGNAVVQMGNLGRIVYGMAANGHLPRRLSGLNRYAVPGLGLIVALALGLIFLLPFPSWYAIGSYAVLTTLLTYVTGGTALGAFTARSRSAKLLMAGALGAIGASLIAYWAGMIPMIPVFITFISALAAFMIIRAVSSRTSMLAVALPYAAAVVFSDYILAAKVFYPLSSGISVPEQAVVRYLALTMLLSVLSTAAALAAGYLMDRGLRPSIRGGAWYVGLVTSIMLVDILGPYGLSSVYGGDPPIPFPFDLAAVAAVTLVAYLVSVLTAPRES